MIDKFINKKNLKILLVISFVFCFLFEFLYSNHDVLKYRSKYKADVLETDGFVRQKKWYVSNKKGSTITLKVKDGYINKINFDYISKKSFKWNIETKDNSIIATKSSSSYINIASKDVNIKTKIIKIRFKDKVKIKNINIDNSLSFSIIRFIIMLSGLAITLILYVYRTYFYNHLEKAFILIGSTVGILLILALPKGLYFSWDDQIHYICAYNFLSSSTVKYSKAIDVIETNFFMKEENFSTSEEKKAIYKKLNNFNIKDKYNKDINNYSTKYNKIIYLPFFIGLSLCRYFDFGFVFSFVIAKVLNLLLYLVLFYFAIKISKNYSKYLFLIGLSFSCMFLASQFSYDPTITAAICLAFSVYMEMIESEKVNGSYLLTFVLSIIWASLPKAIYCPLLFLVLFIPNKKFKNKKMALTIKALISLIAIMLMFTFVLPMFIGNVAGDTRGGNTDASAQFHLILSNPIWYAKVLIKFLITSGPDLFINNKMLYLTGYIGNYVSKVLQLCSQVFYILLLYVVFSNKTPEGKLPKSIKILFGFIYLIIFSLISTALFLSFTEVGNESIAGVQPRYFLPLLPFLLVILTPTIKVENIDMYKINDKLLLLVPLITLIIMLLSISVFGTGF